MSPRFKGQWRPSLFKLMLMIVLLVPLHYTEATNNNNKRSQQQQQSQQTDVDLMEPCYLANNRASESLTISESTPVGTVVGELLVNGDPSTNGNIELSIKMPASGGQQLVASASDSNRQQQQQLPVGTQPQQTNGYSSATKRLGSQVINSQQVADNNNNRYASQHRAGQQVATTQRSARDLSSIIELMPPLSIEHRTKRLILAKKLDRENLDRYAAAGQQLTSSVQSGASGSSSASLTVHVKCQLRGVPAAESDSNNRTNSPEKISAAASKSSSSNSILIPIHLIVTDENDNWPIFINSPYIIDLNETVPIGSPLPGNEIVAVDNDQQGPLSTIEYSIVPGSLYSDTFAFLNPLDSRSLIVKDNHLLDYESQSKLTLKVMARDQGEPSNWAITSLYINLFDNDDLSPVFNEDRYFGQVKENRPGEIIELQPRRLQARDADKTINAPIVYSFHAKTNHSIHFELDAELARLSLKKTLPDNQQPFCLLIRATQADDPLRWTLAAVQVRLASSTRGELEQLLAVAVEGQQTVEAPSTGSGPLRFARSNYTVEVSELAPPGFTVLNLRALHNDKEAADIHYQLLDDDAGHFKLDQRTGALTLNRSIDYEMYRRVSVRVLATYEYYSTTAAGSGGARLNHHHQSASNNNQALPAPSTTITSTYPNLVCDTTRVSVIVINQNDHKPEFSHDQYNLQLSVSDLIASFDPPTGKAPGEPGGDEAALQVASQSIDRLQSNKELLKRFGETDQLDDSAEEPFGWRAMQLGQVYCADRDFGDKVTLQLTGSKANLFHLTQDGRLYLPLVNVSSLAGSGGLAGTGGQLNRKVDSSSTWLASHHARTINNQLVPSKVFFSRRQDRQNLEPPDRDYLNYLLGELSNLGRLRLKVVASDDGQPQAQTSTAIIVISIISIDNFIIQRALLPPKWQPSAASPEATNQTQDVNELQLESSNRSIQQQQQFDYARQVMMIPATNGRSFVQINPDIVSNLILQNGGSSAKTDATSSQPATGGRQQSSSTVLQPEQLSGQPTPPVGDTGTYGQQTKFQPPSLLLVDDDGAKFVAMPAAIEVYNQQVQEAADLLQARQRNQAHLSETSKRLLREADESLWARWKAHFGFSNRDISGAQQGGFLYWINLSSAIMLHLIGLAIIITLLAKLRSSLSTESRTMASLGPRLSWFSHGLSGGGIGNPGGGFVPGDSATGGPDLHSKYSGSQRMSSSENSLGSSYAFMTNHQLDPQQQHLQNLSQQHYVNSSNSSQTSSDSDHSATCSSSYLAGKTVSAGVMVSAASNGGLRRAAATAAASPRIGRNLERVSSNKQSNLFGHLKLTLNKMLDLGEAKPDHSDCGQVTVKALDSDSASFNSFTTDTQPNSSNFATTSAAVEAAKRALPELAKSSTFVGSQQSANSPNSQLDSASAANIVSISVVAVPSAKPPAVELRPNLSPNRKSQRLKSTGAAGNSSSSSVVSLVSMSSSISNKINAAVERTSEHNTGSDASSLDSSTLFNGNQHLLTRANHVLNQTPVPETTSPKRRENTPAPTPAPPPPPPPPPPPSLVQVGMDSLSLQSLTSVNVAGNSLVLNDQRQLSKPFSSRPTEMADNQRAEVTCSPLSPRRPLPQNPVHVRLRQQAAAEQQQAVAAAEKSRKQPAPSKKPPAPQPINLSANRKQTNEERQVAPPTPPPPPPSSLSTSSTKTISPTTSVDRGYESLQSYTSSSHNQQSQQKQQRSEGTTVGEKPTAGGGSRDLSNEFANTKQQQQQWSTGATNSVVGRQSQRTQKLQVLAGSSAGSGEPTTKQQLEQEQHQSAATKHHLLKGRDSDRVIRSSRTLALGAAAAAAQQGLNTPRQLHLPINTGQVQKVANRFRSAKVRTQRFRSSASQQAQQTPVKQQQQQGGYETEDEDFYYCYSNGSRATQTDTTCAPQRHLSSAAQVALAANNPILSDYVSHAYTQRNQAQPHQQQVVELVGSGRARATHNGLDLMLNGESAQHLTRNQRATTIQQVVALPNHHHHHQQQQQQQHHLHQLQHQRQPSNAVYCANNKKQLTWSDQVRIA